MRVGIENLGRCKAGHDGITGGWLRGDVCGKVEECRVETIRHSCSSSSTKASCMLSSTAWRSLTIASSSVILASQACTASGVEAARSWMLRPDDLSEDTNSSRPSTLFESHVLSCNSFGKSVCERARRHSENRLANAGVSLWSILTACGLSQPLRAGNLSCDDAECLSLRF